MLSGIDALLYRYGSDYPIHHYLPNRPLHPLLFLLMSLFLSATEANAQIGHVTHVHDPCIIMSGDYWYIFSTGDRVAIRRSSDLYRWAFTGSIFKDIPSWGLQEVPGVSNIWAPDVFYHNKTYYIFYSLSTFGSNRSRIGLVTNVTLDQTDPNYEWVDRGKVIESNASDNFNAIDPNIVKDKGGRIWMSLGSFWSGIKLIELDTTSLKVKAGARLTSIASRGGDAIEAPFIIWKNGYYYLFVSFDACCQGIESTYRIMVGRAQEITGPYFDRSERSMLSGGGSRVLSGGERWHGTGHCAILSEGDRDWLVYHAYDADNNGIPALRISLLNWDADGWPVVDESNPVNVEDLNSRPVAFRLGQNYPNPFNPQTTIRFQVPEISHVRIKVFNMIGQEVVTLADAVYEPGIYRLQWNGEDRLGQPVSSGTYFYQLQRDGQIETKRLLLLR